VFGTTAAADGLRPLPGRRPSHRTPPPPWWAALPAAAGGYQAMCELARRLA